MHLANAAAHEFRTVPWAQVRWNAGCLAARATLKKKISCPELRRLTNCVRDRSCVTLAFMLIAFDPTQFHAQMIHAVPGFNGYLQVPSSLQPACIPAREYA